MNYIKYCKEITPHDGPLVGGKALSLGIMTQAGLPIPVGFVVTTDAYNAFVDTQIPEQVQKDILDAFDTLQAPTVAVRSSAVAEDSMSASWAGQLETSLHSTRDQVIANIEKCWASLQSERALAYASRQGIVQTKQTMAVVIQKMVNSEVAGVMFSANPITKQTDEIMIEAVYGLGELLVQGIVTPANYLLDKPSLSVKSSTPGDQEIMMVLQNAQLKEVPVSEQLRRADLLSADQLKVLGTYAITLETLYEKPQDSEWASEGDNLYILQSRPITTL